jgi:hypothetical protein
MGNFIIEKDIHAFYVAADSFPNGVLKAHQTLQKLIADKEHRTFYGLSRPDEKGIIQYKATVEEIAQGEAEKLHCEKIVIKKGSYSSAYISDYMNQVNLIGDTFMKLLKHPNLDPEGYCVEEYVGKDDMRCLVRLKD